MIVEIKEAGLQVVTPVARSVDSSRNLPLSVDKVRKGYILLQQLWLCLVQIATRHTSTSG